jgi:hypothetical protein
LSQHGAGGPAAQTKRGGSRPWVKVFKASNYLTV